MPQRNTSACDNLCEVMSSKIKEIDGELYSLGTDCDNCDGCKIMGFELFTYDNRIGFSYSHKIKELYINRNSEMLDFNFCPWCGEPLTHELLEFNKSCLGLSIKLTE